MQIEKGTAADIDAIERLYYETAEYLENHINYPGWKKGIYPAREDAEAGVAEGSLFVVRDGQKLAGSFILRHTPEAAYKEADWGNAWNDEEIFVVYTLAVHPDWQKKGVGGKIIDYILRYSKECGMRAVRLDVYEKNTPAIALYQKHGFKYIDTLDLGYSEFGLNRFELYQKKTN